MKTYGFNSWHELYENLVQNQTSSLSNNSCSVLLLRLSVSIISIFRNIAMHLTVLTCQNMDNGTFFDPNAPAYCTSWKNIKETVWLAVKTLLTYLKNCQHITELEYTEHSEALRSMCGASNQESINAYGGSIKQFADIEQFSTVTDRLMTSQFSLDLVHKKVNRIDETAREIERNFEKKTLKITSKFTLGEIVTEPCDLDSPKADELRVAFETSAKRLFGDTAVTNLTLYDSVQSYNPPADTIEITFEITSADERFLRDYLFYPKGQSRRLWAEIKRALEQKFTGAQIKGPKGWGSGSIIIQVILSKEGKWSEMELDYVDSSLVTFEKFVERYLPRTKCSCKRVQQPKRSDAELEELRSQTVVQVGFDLYIQSTKRFDKEWMIDSMNKILQEKNIKVKSKWSVYPEVLFS